MLAERNGPTPRASRRWLLSSLLGVDEPGLRVGHGAAVSGVPVEAPGPSAASALRNGAKEAAEWRKDLVVGICQPGPFRARNPIAFVTRSFASEALARSGLLNGVPSAPGRACSGGECWPVCWLGALTARIGAARGLNA